MKALATPALVIAFLLALSSRNANSDEASSIAHVNESSTPDTKPTSDDARANDTYEVRRAVQRAVKDVAAKLRPCLVRIETVGGAQPQGKIGTVEAGMEEDSPENPVQKKRNQRAFEDSLGSDFILSDGGTTGLIYSADGYIVSSSFNFVRDPALISVLLADGRRLAADLVARDQVRKIALLKVDATDLPVPSWRSADDVQVGERAVALGLAFGGEQPSVTVGIISALNRMLGNAIQTDAKLSPSNYGGPLCDLQGRVIGLCVPMAQRPGELAGIEMYDSGVGFAVPRNRLDEIVSVLRTGQSFYRGWLGMQSDPRSKESVTIRNIADPSPLRSAGVEVGDKLLSADGRPTTHFGQLVQALYMLPAGQEVYLHLERKGVGYGVKVKLARSTELGELPEVEEPFDPAHPFPEDDKPKKDLFPGRP